MSNRTWSRRLLKYGAFPLVAVLVLYIIRDTFNHRGGRDLLPAMALLLVIGAMIYLKRLENISEKTVTQRIRAEYPPACQPQVFKIYQHLKTRELEGLFLKILDEADGDLNEVIKFAGIAESVGWKAFLENHW